MRVTIERLGHQGDGVADGPVFVPLTLPGEVVEGTLDGDRLTDARILTPSIARVKPPCPHFRRCGGCSLQHFDADRLAEWKAGVVGRALAAHGLVAHVRGVTTSPAASRRRATLHGRRTKKGGLLGFHMRASDQIADIPGCTLLTPGLMTALPAVESLLPLAASRQSEVDFTLTDTAGGIDVAVTAAKPLDQALRAALAETAARGGFARLTWNGEAVVTRSAPQLIFGRARVTPPPGAFLQATAAGEAALQSSVQQALGGASRVADLFAGCGTFALPLAEGAHVHAVESDMAMLEGLHSGWRDARGLKPVTVEARDLFRNPIAAQDLRRFDGVVIDPPRAGAQAQFAELAKSAVPVIAAVSCNPVTFARDAQILVTGGYTLDWVDVVDQFRWSSHVELAARFSRHAS